MNYDKKRRLKRLNKERKELLLSLAAKAREGDAESAFMLSRLSPAAFLDLTEKMIHS